MANSKSKNFDFIVVGTGCGIVVASEAAEHGLKVALIDKGPLVGGTCLNLGCIPSKKLIYVADRIVDIQDSIKFGISSSIVKIDFPSIMRRLRKSRQESQVEVRNNLQKIDNLTFYEGTAQFSSEKTITVNGKKLTGRHIVLATGSRPLIPPIKNLDRIEYLTSETVLELNELPPSLIIIGGGYIAVEYGHFFAAMGSKVTMIEMADRLISSEEPEISELLKKELGKRIDIHTGKLVQEVAKSQDGITVTVKDQKTGAAGKYRAARILIAGGRKSNADILGAGKTGIELDTRGYIKVNERLETSVPGIYAVGDANGTQMFTHMANRQAYSVAENILHKSKLKVDFSFTPHAVFSHPQMASVGLKEAEAKAKHKKVGVGIARYDETAKGDAMMDATGFAKIIADTDTGKILGCHIAGPQAAELIQEVINAMSSKAGLAEIIDGIHIHPAISELIQAAADNLA